MDFLPLDDPRWRELGPPSVPDELSELLKNPADLERFEDLSPDLCSDGTTWPPAYAAVPYIVELAKRVEPQQRFRYLCEIGLVVTCACPEPEGSIEIKDYLVEGYQKALVEALPLVCETLASRHDVTETRYLLAAVAALKGYCKLAEVLQNMDGVCGECPKCGECVFPEELKEAMR